MPLLFCFLSFALLGADFVKITGLQGNYNEKENAFKASFPRNDVGVVVDRVRLNPFLGLTSWASFTSTNEKDFMVMGDLVLFQDEVNPVISSLLENNIRVTALHNHFFYADPSVYFMHIEGKGTLEELANSVKRSQETVKAIRNEHPIPTTGFGGVRIPTKNSIDAANLEKVFGQKGQVKEGMVKFVFGRKAAMGEFKLGSEMGVNTWSGFGGSDENAFVDGDFAVLESELASVIKTLRKGDINIVAIHHHMIEETPRMLFLHYWGKGQAADLAKTIKEALSETGK